jgi:hypothetical protein
MAKPRKRNFYPQSCSCCGLMADAGKLYWSLGWALHPECYAVWFPKDKPAPRKKSRTMKSTLNAEMQERCTHCGSLYYKQDCEDNIYLCGRCYR